MMMMTRGSATGPRLVRVSATSTTTLFFSLFVAVVLGALALAAADPVQRGGGRDARSSSERTTARARVEKDVAMNTDTETEADTKTAGTTDATRARVTSSPSSSGTAVSRPAAAGAESEYPNEMMEGVRIRERPDMHPVSIASAYSAATRGASDFTSKPSFSGSTGTRTVAKRKVDFDGPGAALHASEVPLEIMYGQVGNKTNAPIQARIINGVEVSPPGRYPWMVGVVGVRVSTSGEESESFRCGGSLISPDTVLSASHCYFSSGTASNVGSFDFMRVKIGAHSIDDPQEEIDVVEIIGNPNYVGPTFNNDIALLRLATPVDTDAFTPVRLEWNPDSYAPGTAAVVMGWGTTQDGELSSVLKQADVPLVSREVCTQSGSYPGPPQTTLTVTEKMICAGLEQVRGRRWECSFNDKTRKRKNTT